MAAPLVTIVVPIYNVEKYLDRCLKSIVTQTYTNLEIILIDDGSSDACPIICDQWVKKDNRITAIHKENAGLGMARNTGIEKATGKYIFFFDSDDYVDKTIVEKCVANAEIYQSEAVIYGRCDVYDDGKIEKKRMRITERVFSSNAVKSDILPAMFTYDMGFGVSAWGKMFSLETIVNNGIRFLSEREIISEDAYFALEFFSRASVVTIIDENLYYYYKRSTSLSRVFRDDRQHKNNIFLIKALDFVRESNLPYELEAHIKARYHMFSISAMKQIMESKLSRIEKKQELRKILTDETLCSTLDFKSLLLHKGSLKLFYLLLKLRCRSICKILLYLKNKQKGV